MTDVPRLLAAAWRRDPARPLVRLATPRGVRVLSVAAIAARVAATAKRLRDAGVTAGDRVLVYQAQRLSWLVADLAVISLGAVTMGLMRPAPRWELDLAIARGGPRVALGTVPGLVEIEVADTGDESAIDAWAQAIPAIAPDAPAAVTFTSGSTGEPAAVALSHANLLHFVEAFPRAFPHRDDDAHLSYLSVHRAGVRLEFYLCIALGCAYCVVDPDLGFRRNLALLSPTVLWHTPLFFTQMHDRLRRVPLPRLLAVAGRLWRHSLRCAFSCGAPLPARVERGLREMGLPTFTCYGMTETANGICMNLPTAHRDQSVGRPLPGVRVRIAPDGEVLIGGPAVMLGYLDRPDLSARAVEDGWLRTGDIGTQDDDGYVFLQGRKKSVVLLANGRTVAAGIMEEQILGVSGVRRAIVVGDGRTEVGVLLVPASPASDARDFLARVMPDITRALSDRSAHEQLRYAAVLPRDLLEAEGELTTWGKIRRGVVLAHFAREIEAMYRDPAWRVKDEDADGGPRGG